MYRRDDRNEINLICEPADDTRAVETVFYCLTVRAILKMAGLRAASLIVMDLPQFSTLPA